MFTPWTGLALLLGGWAALGAVIAAIRHLFNPHPEINRKMIHLTTTSIALSFPWVFHDAWPPVAVCAVALAVMIAVRLPALDPLVRAFGLADSRRLDSWGEFYYPVAIAVLYLTLRDDRPAYVIPILAVGAGDTAAAVIGKRWGRLRFLDPSGVSKSVEGTLAFVFATIPTTIFVLFTWGGMAWTPAILLSGVLAVYLSLLEAMAWEGLDNLFVPAGAVLLLRTLGHASSGVLMVHLAVVSAAAAGAAAWLTRDRWLSAT